MTSSLGDSFAAYIEKTIPEEVMESNNLLAKELGELVKWGEKVHI